MSVEVEELTPNSRKVMYHFSFIQNLHNTLSGALQWSGSMHLPAFKFVEQMALELGKS